MLDHVLTAMLHLHFTCLASLLLSSHRFDIKDISSILWPSIWMWIKRRLRATCCRCWSVQQVIRRCTTGQASASLYFTATSFIIIRVHIAVVVAIASFVRNEYHSNQRLHSLVESPGSDFPFVNGGSARFESALDHCHMMATDDTKRYICKLIYHYGAYLVIAMS